MSTILAIDLGKFNSVLCWFEPETRSSVFRTVKTAPEVLRTELLRQTVKQIVFEACSQAGWVHDLCEELGGGAATSNSYPPNIWRHPIRGVRSDFLGLRGSRASTLNVWVADFNEPPA